MTIEEMIENLKDRRRDASADVASSHRAAPNSYGAGYDQGYLDVLEELLNDVARASTSELSHCASETP
jgi:hypothetical protein